MDIREKMVNMAQAAKAAAGVLGGVSAKNKNRVLRLMADNLNQYSRCIIQENHKVLIFSQFVKMLRIIQENLNKEQIPYSYLDGKTKKRQEQINNFQNNPDIKIFLISLKAGGTGLNLTAADYVIHVDPWWNPAVELQATDRAHRIGQLKKVFVYKLITSSTVEEKILNL